MKGGNLTEIYTQILNYIYSIIRNLKRKIFNCLQLNVLVKNRYIEAFHKLNYNM